MPIYAYRCSECGAAHEALQKLSAQPLIECPACGKPALVKQVTAAGFQLKGSGWYVTDFRGGGQGKDEAKSQDEAKGKDAASDNNEGKSKDAAKIKDESKGKSDQPAAHTKPDAAAPSSGSKTSESSSSGGEKPADAAKPSSDSTAAA